nr:hypothetical protein [Tanacetum cinerariifolium]
MSSLSSSSHTTVTYTCVSSGNDLPSRGIPLMEAYEPEAPLSPVYAFEYSEYLAPSDDDITPAEDQPLPASPIAFSLGYIADSELITTKYLISFGSFTISNLEEDPEMDIVNYAADEEDEESSSYKEEEEEHLAPADSALFVSDSVPSVEETEPFTTNESATTPPLPRSPQTVILLSQTSLRRARKTRARFTAPSQRFEIRESSANAAARQLGFALLSWIL